MGDLRCANLPLETRNLLFHQVTIPN